MRRDGGGVGGTSEAAAVMGETEVAWSRGWWCRWREEDPRKVFRKLEHRDLCDRWWRLEEWTAHDSHPLA